MILHRRKENISSFIFNRLNEIFMACLMFLTFYPILYIIFASFSRGSSLLSHTGLLFGPLDFSLEGYKMVFKNPMIVRGYSNTIFVVFVGGFISVFLTSISAYVLSRQCFMLQKPIMLFVIFTMFFNGGMIPFYFTVRNLGLYNSIWALILPTAMNTFNLIIMRTGFTNVPETLYDAAKIDGADHFCIFFSICVPLVKPVIAVISLYYLVGKWNEWFNAMLFLKDMEKYPLQLVLRGILIVNDTSAMTDGVGIGDQVSAGETVKYGVIVVATLPILFIYPFLQKYFVKGVMIGAIKG